jgi:hypothetical protein
MKIRSLLTFLNRSAPATPASGQTELYVDAADKLLKTKDDAGVVTAISGGGITGTAIFGDGSDGALVYDGSTTILGMAPSSNVYTLTRDIYATNLTVNAGVTIKTANFRIFVNGTLTLVTGSPGGVIHNNANAAVNGAGGTAPISFGLGTFSTATVVGAAGGVNTAGGNGTASLVGYGGNGGAGGSATNAGGAAGVVTAPPGPKGSPRNLLQAITYTQQASTSGFSYGASGGGGGSNNASAIGGGGGAGGAIVGIYAKTIIVNAGAIISANGGNGANGSGTNNAGGGGGGGGGVVILVYNSYTNAGTVQAIGGTHGNGLNAGNNGNDGNAGTVITLNNNA